jgi:hypothetical protein
MSRFIVKEPKASGALTYSRHDLYLSPDQIDQMYEANQFNNRLQFLNDYFESDIQERREREELVQAYREWGSEEEGLASPEHGDGSEE